MLCWALLEPKCRSLLFLVSKDLSVHPAAGFPFDKTHRWKFTVLGDCTNVHWHLNILNKCYHYLPTTWLFFFFLINKYLLILKNGRIFQEIKMWSNATKIVYRGRGDGSFISHTSCHCQVLWHRLVVNVFICCFKEYLLLNYWHCFFFFLSKTVSYLIVQNNLK